MSVEFGVISVEFGVISVEFGVWSLEFKVSAVPTDHIYSISFYLLNKLE